MYSLFLYDTSFHQDLYTQDTLNNYLQDIQFINIQKGVFTPSDQFMMLITFLGCSPNIKLEVKTEIKTSVKWDISAYGGNSIEKLVCPNCKSKIQDPSLLISKFNKQKNWHSLCCKHKIDIQTINWRKSAGFSQSFIQINNIFPKEAIPSDQLLLLLSNFSQSNWNYFYSKQEVF